MLLGKNMSKFFIRMLFFVMVVGFFSLSSAEEKAVVKERTTTTEKVTTVDKNTTEKPISTEGKGATSILLFGDGIVAGYKLTESETLSVQLEKVLLAKGLYVKVINGGISGETTAGGRERIVAALKKNKPDIVFIALGRSDMLKGFLLEAIRANLRKIIEVSKEHGSFVILSAVDADPSLRESYRNGFESIYRELSEEYKLPLYPFLLKQMAYSEELVQQDRLHPTPRGVLHIANGLANYFATNMGPDSKIEKIKIEKEQEKEQERERLIKIREENEAKRKKEEEELLHKDE